MNKYQPNEKTKPWVDTVLKNYLKHNTEDQTEIEHILDFLASPEGPKRIDRVSYPQAKKAAHDWTEMLRKRGEEVVETEDDVEEFLQVCDKYRFVKLVTKEAYEREGNLMRHCVASYFDRDDVEIYSLRDPLNKPHCTIELTKSHDEIHQIKGKGNGSIHPKYIRAVLAFLKEVGAEVSSHEMENLGYLAMDETLAALVQNKTRNAKTLTVGGVSYIYVHQELELVE